MTPIDHAEASHRLARIERMIEHYRLEKTRRLKRQVITLWRKIETQQALIAFEKPLERIH